MPVPPFHRRDADGGYAECLLVDEDYAYLIPEAFDDEHAAPLLCAASSGTGPCAGPSCRPGAAWASMDLGPRPT